MKTKRIAALTLIIVMLLAALPIGGPALADRTPSPWAVPEMSAANTSGLLTPSAARDFHTALTRDEFCELVVVMVEQTLGRELPVPAANPFVDDRDPISIHALKAWNYGIITGITTTLFAPAQKVERQQLCAMMIRAIRGLESGLRMTLLSPGVATLPYRDAAQIRDYAVDPVKLAYSNDIMQGTETGYFLPGNDVTSQECVAVIIRSFNRIESARTPGMASSQLLDLAVNRVHIGYAYGDNEYGVSQNITLPTTSSGGSTVSWTSSNSNVISISGTTGIVNIASAPRTVTLTATIRIGNNSRTKTFDLTTSQNSGDRLLLDNAVNELDILYLNEGDGNGSVTGRIGLPTTVLGLPVTWQSSNTAIVSTAGIVAVPSGSETRNVTLTATIRSGNQSRTKTFNLIVANPAYNRGVTLHGVQLGLTSAQTAQILGTARRSIAAANNETWQLFYNTNYSNFIAVAFIGDRAVAVYSMASGVANQLRNRSNSVISIAEANSWSGVGAVSYTDPGNSSQQYAIMIYDTTTAIGTYRTMIAEGQEQLLYELVNAFRQRNSRSALEWAAKLGTATRAYSSAGGTGTNLQQRVINAGFDSARYSGGNIIPGNGDAIDALDQIVRNSTGSSSMRSAILGSSLTMFGAGFAGSNSGNYRTYFSYALSDVVYITNATAIQSGTNVSTVNVNTGNANAMIITLTISPSGFNESLNISSSNDRIMTVSEYSAANRTVKVTGVANGTANIIVKGNCSDKSFNIPVSVGAVYADNLTLTYTGPGTATTLTTSSNVQTNTNPTVTWPRTLVMGTGDTLTITAATTNGSTVEWSSSDSSVATVSRNAANNNVTVTAAAAKAGTITITAQVRSGSGSNHYITHRIPLQVVSVTAITLDPATVSVGGPPTKASVTVSNLPASGTGYTPEYLWTSTAQLTRTTAATDPLTATFRADTTGTATITYTATWSGANSLFIGKITRSLNVTIQNQYATGITVSQSGAGALTQGQVLAMIPGQTLHFSASPIPANITQSAISYSWSAFPAGVVTVGGSGSNNASGAVTALTEGPVVITVKLNQGSGEEQSFSFSINVDWPTFDINNPGAITKNVPVQFGFNSGHTLDALKNAGYEMKWFFFSESDIADMEESSGWLVPNDSGTGIVVAELWFEDSRIDWLVKELPITIIDPI